MASKFKIVLSALGLLATSNLAIAASQTPALRICADPGNKLNGGLLPEDLFRSGNSHG